MRQLFIITLTLLGAMTCSAQELGSYHELGTFSPVKINHTYIVPGTQDGMHSQTIVFSDMVIFQSVVFYGPKVHHRGYIEVVGVVTETSWGDFPYVLTNELGEFFISKDGFPYEASPDEAGRLYPSDKLF